MKTGRMCAAMDWFARSSVLLAAVLVLALSGPSAHAGFRKPSVLILHAEANGPWVTDVRDKLNSSSQFSSVGTFNAIGSTPTLAQLLPYDAVLLFTDSLGVDTTTLGNNLADYVDAGGGVVSMTFAHTFSAPGGRWNPGYLCLAAGGAQTQGTLTTLNLGSITNQNHPILIGVGSFSGGVNSFRTNQANVVAGATVVARWSDNTVFAATGPLPGRVDLNFFPPSKDARSDFWDPSTDGVKLMVNSLLYVIRPRVLIAGAETNPAFLADVKSKVFATGIVGITDTFNTGAGTPTLAQLQTYDAVLTWTDAPAQNPAALGNALADYVDAGGGVVTAVFSQSTNWSIDGRWENTYELIVPAPSFSTGAASLGVVAYPTHPTMSGVVSFHGGSSSFRPAGGALNSGAFSIAQWTDGKPLVVGSTKFANRIDLGFFPPSNSVDARFWQVGTNGDKIMANALLYTVKPYVACVNADPSFAADPVAKLAASRRFSGVANVPANVTTPSAATLQPFHAVLTWSNSSFENAGTLGDRLADFVDAGGGAVTAVFGNTDVGSGGFFLAGRWSTQGYDIVPLPLPFYVYGPPASLGAILEPAHPVNAFVRRFDGGVGSYRANSNPPLRGREILRWSDGRMLASVHNFKKRVDLGMFPPSSTSALGPAAWNQRTDGTWLMANALEYAARHKPCPGDFNGDGQVDDADFVLFLNYYNNLLDPRGDLSGDGQTDDADFLSFVSGYDTLVCP